MATKKKETPGATPGKEKKKNGPNVIEIDGDRLLEKLDKAKKKTGGKKNASHDPNDEPVLYKDAIGNDISIVSAEIKDLFCNYTYSIKQGANVGDEHKVKGKGIVDEDMREAFQKLRVHLANIDDAFILYGEDVKNIQGLTDHELTQNYIVTGIKIKGGSDSELVSLIGNKYCTYAPGRIHLETPLIAMDNLSSYKWSDDLREVVNSCRKEVAEYMNGKFTLPEPAEKENPNQLKITDMIDKQEQDNKSKTEQTPGDEVAQAEEKEVDFDAAKVE